MVVGQRNGFIWPIYTGAGQPRHKHKKIPRSQHGTDACSLKLKALGEHNLFYLATQTLTLARGGWERTFRQTEHTCQIATYAWHHSSPTARGTKQSSVRARAACRVLVGGMNWGRKERRHAQKRLCGCSQGGRCCQPTLPDRALPGPAGLRIARASSRQPKRTLYLEIERLLQQKPEHLTRAAG